MFSRKLLFSCSVLTLLVSASVGHLTMLDTVLTMVGKMDSLHLAIADMSGSWRVSNGAKYEYQADFSCQNGTMDAGQFTLADGPYLTGSDGEAQLQFTVSVGSTAVNYTSCQEVTTYPANHVNHVYNFNSRSLLIGNILEARCTVGIKREGFSCSTESSVYIPTNVTAMLDTWWNDCPGCEIVIADNINQTLHESLIPVVENIVRGSDLCFLLDY